MISPRVIYFGVSPQKLAAEVGGWSNVDQMGLKDALTYDTTTRKYHSYTKPQITDLTRHLQTADLIVGFNQLQFDYKILSPYTDTDLDALPNFDMLSKIKETLNFPIKRDNLAQNTLGESKRSKGRATLGKRIDTTKKLFAHGCKEGTLFYRSDRFGTKGVCDTSSWANIARSITQRKHLLDPIVAPSEPELPQFTPIQQISNESPKEKPVSESITTLPTRLSWESPRSLPTTRQVDSARRLSPKEYLRSKYLTPEYLMITQGLDKSTIGERIPEEALQVYSMAKSQHHHAPELYTYKKVADLLDSGISFQQFNVAIIRLWLDQRPLKHNYKKENFRYYYIDGSSTVASERVNDYVDIRNIKEELVRGV